MGSGSYIRQYGRIDIIKASFGCWGSLQVLWRLSFVLVLLCNIGEVGLYVEMEKTRLIKGVNSMLHM
jgi:hypothetical protein